MVESAVTVLLRGGNRVVRPQDAAAIYADPAKEFARLTERGVMMRLRHGYYVIVPEESRGGAWRPSPEGVALGIAVADYGRVGGALMHLSAARVHGAVPRAIAAAAVASSTQRATRTFGSITVSFHKRNLDHLDLQPVRTDVTQGLATSREQTILDLADRPDLVASPEAAAEALSLLGGRADWGLVAELAASQRKPAALARARWVGAAVADVGNAPRPRRPVPSLALRPARPVPSGPFGVAT